MKLPAALVANPAVRGLVALMRRMIEHSISRAASAMAFGFFLGLVPLLALAGWLIASLGDAHVVTTLATPLLDAAPPQAAQMARDQFQRLAEPGALAPVSIVGFIWISSGGAHTAIATLHVISGAPRRTWVRTRLMATAFVLVALVVVTATTVSVVFLERLTAAGAMTSSASQLGRILAVSSSLLATAGTIALLYRVTAGRSGAAWPVWPGAGVAVVAFGALSVAFSFYASTLGRFAAFYGGLAAVALLLTWLWLCSVSLLVGAELNALLARRAAQVPVAVPAPAS